MSSPSATLSEAFASIEPGYNPPITYVICGKRHHIRFFPSTQDGGDRSGNVRAGTVIDLDIVHPTDNDFVSPPYSTDRAHLPNADWLSSPPVPHVARRSPRNEVSIAGCHLRLCCRVLTAHSFAPLQSSVPLRRYCRREQDATR